VRWVLDASVAVRWFLAAEELPPGAAVLDRLTLQPYEFAVPELFPFEVLSVLCRTHAEPFALWSEAVLPLLQGGMFRQPMTGTLASGAREFVAAGLGGYDACYASLARELGATWLTWDRRAHRRITALGVSHCLADGLPPGW
jgi:predicted nucleic acid-binding protein